MDFAHLHAVTRGFVQGGFSLLSLEACSCRGFVVFLSVAGLCNCTKRKFEFASCVSVHEP